LDESGKEMPMLGPLAPTLRQRAKAAERDARQLLAMREIFSEELANSPAFVKEVSDALQSFYEKGARSPLALVNSIA
jgi:mannitol-1-phosphate/altronate dehydrogenase